MLRYLRALESCHRLPKYPSMAMLSHRQGWSLAGLLLCFPLVLLSASASDPPQTSYRTGTSEVRVSFFATDENNHLVETLTRDDFAVVDSGMVIRDFRSFTRSEETRLDISLLIDTSESVAPRFHETTADVSRLLSQRYLTSADRISVIAFSGLQPRALCDNDCTDPATLRRVSEIKAGGATPLFDTILYSARLMSKRRAAGVRQVLILFSDGNDTVSMASAREALDAVLATGAVLYTIDLDSSKNTSNQSTLLKQMAEAAGGRSFAMRQGALNALQAVLADLHASYVVTYELPNHVSGFHSLRILPKHNLNLQFHSRRGYSYDEIH